MADTTVPPAAVVEAPISPILGSAEAHATTRAAHRRRQRGRRALLNGIALGVIMLSAFPVYWMVNTSFRRSIDIRNEMQFLPFGGTLENYRSVFDTDNFWSSFGNSLKVTGLTVLFALFSAFLAALAVSRFRFRGRVGFLVMILIVQMIPAEAMMISLVKVLDGWDLRNSIMGLTIAYVAFVLPFTVWTLRGFVAGVPKELEEAAMVDGSSRLRAFFTITLPLVAPGLVATGIFAFIQAWNEYTYALVIMDRPEKSTLPLWLQQFNFGARGTDWGGVMAGSVLITLPVVVFFLLVHRRIAAGMTAGAVKG
ncbi:MAG TPA: carbohydrate ABC transporter permease [Acidimicrobiales bacterium]|jgi:N,N'-diacetylchitobiose transport system permease protein